MLSCRDESSKRENGHAFFEVLPSPVRIDVALVVMLAGAVKAVPWRKRMIAVDRKGARRTIERYCQPLEADPRAPASSGHRDDPDRIAERRGRRQIA